MLRIISLKLLPIAIGQQQSGINGYLKTLQRRHKQVLRD